MIIIYMGGAWRLSKRNYLALRVILDEGRQFDLNALGRYLGPCESISNLMPVR